jgi:Flp pilus assembly protein TadG
MSRVRQFQRDEHGALVVEFGLIVPILLLLVFGIVDFGRAYFTMNNLAAAVREGARYGSVLEKPWDGTWPDSIKQHVVNFSYSFGGARLSTPNVSSSVDKTAGTVTVTANYTFRAITPLVNLIGLDSIPMTQTAVFRMEYYDPTTAPSTGP